MSTRFILGLDGGGTKTDAVLCDEQGHVVARAIGAASSITGQGTERAQAALHAVIEAVTAHIPDKSQVAGCYAGISGGGLAANQEKFREMISQILPDCKGLACGSDAINVLTAGVGTKNGIIAIAGTGSCIYARIDGVMKQVGGWGYLLGDEGSGFDLGRRALISALKALDGRGKETVLVALLESKLGMTLREYIPVFYRSDAKTEVASLAPLLLQAAADGDPVAQEQAREATMELAHGILTADRLIGERCVVIGGSVWKNDYYRSLVKKNLGCDFKLINIDLPPVYGAVLEAAAQAGITATEAFKDNFRTTLKEK